MRRVSVLCILVATAPLAPWSGGPALWGDEPTLPAAATGPVDFSRDVQPIFAKHCYACHGPEKQESNFRLDQPSSVMRGGDLGEPAVAPGRSAASLLVRVIAGVDENLRMPPEGELLSAEEVGRIRAWIDQGAQWPKTPEEDNAAPLRTDHWSFQPLRSVAAPPSSDPRIQNPIDAFLLQRLGEEQLDFSPPAPRADFLRRLYFDMLGLPPSREETHAFLADSHIDAVERLVDQVLASPRYGERWARHWLDVVRFAETSGFETNFERPNAYHYRDYVIDALNDDTPYTQFVREQLAGDAFGADAATGFLVGGAYDRVKSPDPALTLMQRQDELADMLNTTGTAFLGLTVGCARCHNHKFDPITQRDYYSLQAVFAGVEHGDRVLRSAETGREKQQLAEVEQQLTAVRVALTEALALREPVQAKVNEERFPPTEVRWVRFTIHATNNGIEPCIDELEVYAASAGAAAPVNVALAAVGAAPTASGTYPGSEIHRLEHIHDGRHGNGRSWISNTRGTGWVQIELAQPTSIDRIVWGRDREEIYQDRVPTDYVIEGALTPGQWQVLATSADRASPGVDAQTAWRERLNALPLPAQAAAKQLLDDFARLQQQRAQLQVAVNAMAYAGVFQQPGMTHRLYRGDPMQPREEVPPAAPEVFSTWLSQASLPSDTAEQARRLHLAEWITSEQNPLTARVIVNRLWHYHFGAGLVATPSDFGEMGASPTHPELLDWLAGELIRSGWSLKHLHRLILTSHAYRQSSIPDAAALAKDAESCLLWRFPPRRLEAEVIRDQMLAVSGVLDLRMHGPGYSAFLPNDNYVRVYEPKETWGPPEWRRMVYMLKVRMDNDAVFGAFDCPDAGQPAPRRTESTTPLQALNLLHSSFVLQQADLFAQRVKREASPEVSSQVNLAFVLALGREPTAEEAAAGVALVEQHGLVELCRVLFNANEFLFVP